MKPFRSARAWVKSTIRAVGFDVARTPSDLWLRRMGIKTVIDVGANVGQFAIVARRLFPEAMIYSFEPMEDAYHALLNRFHHDNRFRAFQFALGSLAGKADFHRSSYSPSSSLLQMADLHKQYFPYTAGEELMAVEVRRLDDVVLGLQLQSPLLVKLDVQGYEDQVIAGGGKCLGAASVVIVEVSFEPLYVGQPMFEGIHEMLLGLGLRYRGSWEQLRAPADGRLVQADAIYMR